MDIAIANRDRDMTINNNIRTVKQLIWYGQKIMQMAPFAQKRWLPPASICRQAVKNVRTELYLVAEEVPEGRLGQ